MLESARPGLEAGLAGAERELEELEERRHELIRLIAQARAALGLSGEVVRPTVSPERSLTLHDALAQILREHGNAWMAARELVDEVNARRLYRKRDGSAVELNQIHARTKNYGEMFEKEGSRIRLRNA
jgi:hypothetical protein